MYLRTENHFQLGQLLLRQGPRLSLRHRCAFLLGCIEPDLNLLTYLRGALSQGLACGHNFSRTLPPIARLSASLCRRGVHSSRDAFRLGVLLHYVADAFTLTHNDGFSGGVLAHNRYEAKLKDVFARTLFTHPLGAAALAQGSARDFPSLFLRAHRRYLAQPPGPDTDTRFISDMSLLAFSLFVPHSAFQTPLEEPA